MGTVSARVGYPYRYYINRQFWCRGYYVDTTGKNTKAISEYIKYQLDEDKIQDQTTMKEFVDPFKSGKEQAPRSCQTAKSASRRS